MFHGLTSEILYCVCRLRSVFRDDMGTEKEISGTAFSLIDGAKHVLVTNAHLVDLNHNRLDQKYIRFTWQEAFLEVLGKDAAGLPTKPLRYQLPSSHNAPLFHANRSNDVAVFFDPQVLNLDGSTNRQFDYCIKMKDVATAKELAEEILPFDLVAFPGFPPWHSNDGPRAIVRGGTIASDPRYGYSNSGVENQEVILYEAFSFNGSSGSPVLAVPKAPPLGFDPDPANKFRRFLLVGVNAGHLLTANREHSGMSYFVRASVLRDIIEKRVADGA